MATKASTLIKDLNSVPAIVGGLGLSIAEAQKAFNLDYMDNIERLVGVIRSLAGGMDLVVDGLSDAEKAAVAERVAQHKEFVNKLLAQLAPSRYQFTETTLMVKLDLAQSMDLSVQAGFGANLGAVAMNAGMAMAYGKDYRAAAEVTVLINAIPADTNQMNTLIARADKISAKSLTLPEGAQVDAQIVDKAHKIVEKLIGAEPKAPEIEPPAGD